MSLAPVLIAGQWRPAAAVGEFQAEDPAAKQPLAERFPISGWSDVDEALRAAAAAADTLRTAPDETIAGFFERYAERIEARAGDLCALAHLETALPAANRLQNVELPRTVNQLRQAAQAARAGDWRRPIIDSKLNIRSCLAPIGPVCVFGPNNFPFAFNSVAGGDFAAALAAGNPVIAKANSSHPGTTRLFAEEAHAAAAERGLPSGAVQLLYRLPHADGERLVADPRVGASAYTGSRHAGLKLKAAADAAGKPIYLELSSVNPVVVLPGALRERLDEIAEQFATSCLMGVGQFCTNPGLVLTLKCDETERFIARVAERFRAAPVGTLLSRGVETQLRAGLVALRQAGAAPLVGEGAPAAPAPAPAASAQGYHVANTLLRVDGAAFLRRPTELQAEAFGNASLVVVADSAEQAGAILEALEGNLTGCVYSHRQGEDDALYDRLAPKLRRRVGRLLNDKMPTGVAVTAAMNHGGPFPATGHPVFTAVGLPTAIERFTTLHCFDNVRPERLPACLRDRNPTGKLWRQIDGRWTQADAA